jgi:hypothetical protein
MGRLKTEVRVEREESLASALAEILRAIRDGEITGSALTLRMTLCVKPTNHLTERFWLSWREIPPQDFDSRRPCADLH